MAYPLDSNDLTEPKTTIVNILKMEGYKLDSGSLFLAFKDAGGEMAQFTPSLEELQEEQIIKSDSEGNIMTVEDYQREKSQNKEDIEEIEESSEEEADLINEEIQGKDIMDDNVNDSSKMSEMLKKKEETDAWIVEKAKNGSKNTEKLSLEIAELSERVKKLENIIEKINEALR
ncbi:MAG: hypothetical protein BEU01_00860 [Marine Group III euryarchaeote CG-Epi4]|uniref:Uncharacterized protein n=1 Tax=Marine Group III euryarchaeote CG-Epi4 TaxID=1888998 RepID=A0A1J5TKZ2_9ARCH|nr:MAG: hypothetical protein BEU01_00860 [Marine Group III euryarchaeote CG-Epi4]